MITSRWIYYRNLWARVYLSRNKNERVNRVFISFLNIEIFRILIKYSDK